MRNLLARLRFYWTWLLRSLRHRFSDDFVFVHINKTGGSSIEVALKLNLEHKTAVEKIAELGPEKWRRRFTFAIVRNPWDRVVSHYAYRVKTNQTNLRTQPVEFKDWVKLTYGQQDPRYHDNPKMFMPQSRWITDGDGELLVDFVGRFENLGGDFQQICDKLGRNLELPHVKASTRGQYQEYYDAETREIVGRWFADDIERFGYRFSAEEEPIQLTTASAQATPSSS